VVSHWNRERSAWEPYSDIEDLQLEFTMLDPHIRTALPPVPDSPGEYSVTFRAPDRHGVFKFVINYKRRGCVCSTLTKPPLFLNISSFLFILVQIELFAELDYRFDRASTSRRIPPVPQRGMAVLCRGDQHKCWVRAVLGAVAGWGRQGQEGEVESEG
jgi:hypothetical protein